MTKLEEMWLALLAYLPHAIANGHGGSWATMCGQKTAVYAACAARAADNSNDVAAYAAAAYATHAADSDADDWAQKATDRITAITTALA